MTRLIKKFAPILMGELGQRFFIAISAPLIVRILTTGQYGELAFLLAIVNMLSIISLAGIPAGIRKYLSHEEQTSDWHQSILTFYLRIEVVILALIAAFAIAIIISSEQAILGIETKYVWVIAALLVSRLIFRSLRAALMAANLERYSEALSSISPLLVTILGVPLAISGLDVMGIMLGHLFSTIIMLIASGYVFHKYSPWRLPSLFENMPHDVPRKKLISYSGIFAIHAVLGTSLLQVDLLVIGSYTGSTQTGYYKAAAVTAQFLWIAPYAIQTLFTYSIATLWNNNDYGEIEDIVSKTTRLNLLFVCLLASGLLIVGDIFLEIYFGKSYSQAYLPLLILLPGAVGYAVARPIIGVIFSNSKTRSTIALTGFCALLNLILNLALVPRFGISGAAFATSTSFFLMLFLHTYNLRRHDIDAFKDLRAQKVTITFLVTIFFLHHLSNSMNGHKIITIAIIAVVGFSIYWLIALFFGAIDVREVREFYPRIE